MENNLGIQAIYIIDFSFSVEPENVFPFALILIHIHFNQYWMSAILTRVESKL